MEKKDRNLEEYLRKIIYFFANSSSNYTISEEFARKYPQGNSGYIANAKIVTPEYDTKQIKPSQKWHLFASYPCLRFKKKDEARKYLNNFKSEYDKCISMKISSNEAYLKAFEKAAKESFGNEFIYTKIFKTSNFYSRLKCPELALWMAQAAGISKEEENGLTKARDEAIKIIDIGEKRARFQAGIKIVNIIKWERLLEKIKQNNNTLEFEIEK